MSQKFSATAASSIDTSVSSGSTKCEKAFTQKFLLNKNQTEDILEAFNLFDEDGTGKITVKALVVVIRALGFEANKADIKKLIEATGTGDGLLCFRSFLEIVQSKMAQKDSTEDIMKAFRLIDSDSTGKITKQNLRDVADALGEDLNDEELQEMMSEGDLSGSGHINLDRFIRLIWTSPF